MVTSFGHNAHHAISQKLKKKKKLVHIPQNRQFTRDPIYIYITIFIDNFINSLVHT